jgi:hypothetical protein
MRVSRAFGLAAAIVLLTGCAAILGLGDPTPLVEPGEDGDQPDAAAGRDGEAGTSVCTDTSSDPKNCGRCGHDCLGGACSGGHCAPVELARSGSFLAASEAGWFWGEKSGAIYACPAGKCRGPNDIRALVEKGAPNLSWIAAGPRFLYLSTPSLGRCPVTGCVSLEPVWDESPSSIIVDEPSSTFFYTQYAESPRASGFYRCSIALPPGHPDCTKLAPRLNGIGLFLHRDDLIWTDRYPYACYVMACNENGCAETARTLLETCTGDVVGSGSRLVFSDEAGRTLRACDLPDCKDQRGVTVAPSKISALAADDRRIYWFEEDGTLATCVVDGPCEREVLAKGDVIDAASVSSEIFVGRDALLFRRGAYLDSVGGKLPIRQIAKP